MDPTTIWMALAPGATTTRVVATHGPQATLLRATLRRTPCSPHALQALLEALALWEGTAVRAALVVDAACDGYGTTPWRAAALDFGATPLYTLTWLEAARRREPPGSDAHAFRALARRLPREVAR